MRAAFYTEYGGPEVLQVGELPDPVTGPDDVVVRVSAAGVNPVDWKIRQGYLDGAFPSHFPLVPGWDVAGTVEAVGPATSAFAVGDRVLGYVRKDHVQHGTSAELVRAAVRHLAPLPDEVSFEAGGALPLAGLTALQAVEAAGVGPDDTVLVHAAAGGVGASPSSSPACAAPASSARPASRTRTSCARSAPSPSPTATASSTGSATCSAARASPPPSTSSAAPPSPTPSRSSATRRGWSRSPTARRCWPAAGATSSSGPDSAQLGDLARLVADGSLHVEVAATFDLADVAEAHRRSETGHGRGKVVVTV